MKHMHDQNLENTITVRVQPRLAGLTLSYLELCGHYLSLVKALANRGEFSAINRVGDAIKNTSVPFSLMEVAALGRSLEVAALSQDPDQVHQVCEEFVKVLARIRVEPIET